MMKEFNCYNLSNPYTYYKYRYEMLITKIKVLAFSVGHGFKSNIGVDAKRVIDETFQFDGYVECLFDLDIISESDFEKFWLFTKQIRYDSCEILLYLDSTI